MNNKIKETRWTTERERERERERGGTISRTKGL